MVLDSLACPDKSKMNIFHNALKFCLIVAKVYLYDAIGGNFDKKYRSRLELLTKEEFMEQKAEPHE